MIGDINEKGVSGSVIEPEQQAARSRGGSHRAFLAYLLLAVLVIKLTLLAIDSYPRFLMGDSGSYLYTALTGWIPYDRSFTYGLLIRPLSVLPHSLAPLLVFQTLLGAFSSWIAGFCLLRYFEAPRWLAAAGALLCAIEPLQLFAERSVLTETVSIFLFAMVVWLSLDYLQSRRLLSLIAIQLLSVALISIRLSYLPLVIADSILLPLLGPMSLSFFRAMTARKGGMDAHPNGRVLRPFFRAAAHLGIAVMVCQAALYGYRHWNGHLTHRAPAYNYSDGLFLASFWAPVIESRDFPIADLRDPIFNHLVFDLKNPKFRNNQCFSPGGLDENIIKETTSKFGGDGLTYPNKLAKKTALRAAKRNPLGLLHLFYVTAQEYFDPTYFRSTVQLEEGSVQVAGAEFDRELRDDFHQGYAPQRSTMIQRWHLSAEPWYQFLLLAPLVFLITAVASGRPYAREKIFFGVAVYGLTLGAIALTQEPSVRYMVPDAWLAPLIFGAPLAAMLSRRSRATLPFKSQRDNS
ncbi:MAG TPA: hypothetical protein VG168_06620 [Bryobacteraceae bacterium]|nr:hypothetical protein [Bryobacteraceae bacterium]